MEAPLSSHAAPMPRNLVPHVAAWLRRLGFTATERDHVTIATVEAYWQGRQGLRFYFDYQWSARKATCHLALYYSDTREPLDLIKGQHVRRLKEVRQLLLNNERFRAEYRSACQHSIPTNS